MTRFLASVKNKSEAETAFLSGADIIDLKNPAEGSLGSVSIKTVQTVTGILKNRAIISATVGDLPPEPGLVNKAVERLIKYDVDIIKIGFFPGHQHRLASSLSTYASQNKLVAVLFADQKPDRRLLKTLSESNFYGVILDTARKNDRGLLQYFSTSELKEFIQLSHHLHLQCGLAGQLRHSDITGLLALNPDYLGFRSALCHNKRSGELSKQAIQQVRKAIPQNHPATKNNRQIA